MKMEQLMATKESNEQILGKFIYFGLSNVLIERDTLSEICESISFPVKPGARLSEVDAFKSATGDLYERLVTKEYGEVKISKVYCRDNQSNSNIISRELVKETLGENTNHYKKLANIFFDKETGYFNYSIENYDHEVSVNQHCDRAEELFALYKRCAGRNQIENMTDSFLNQMEALKISIHGRLFFVPKKSMHMLDIFEDFLEALNQNNQRNGQLTVNSMFVIDDAKQRDKMTAEFYNSTKKEIELYTEKLEHLISNSTQSPAIIDRWIVKIGKLEEKKCNYEEILRHELTELDDQYGTLKFLAQELSIRANKVRMAKCA